MKKDNQKLEVLQTEITKLQNELNSLRMQKLQIELKNYNPEKYNSWATDFLQFALLANEMFFKKEDAKARVMSVIEKRIRDTGECKGG